MFQNRALAAIIEAGNVKAGTAVPLNATKSAPAACDGTIPPHALRARLGTPYSLVLRLPLFGGGAHWRNRLAQHRFSRSCDAGASEKARVLATEQPHDIREHEVAEISRARQPV